jgi:transaldolase
MTGGLAAGAASAGSASPLQLMTERFATRLFNDSCSSAELAYSISHGATGATSNPVICLTVLKEEAQRWLPRVPQIAAQHPTWSDEQVAWLLYTEMGAAGAAQLLPVFESHGKTWGRLSVQTNPSLYRDSAAMLAQSVSLAALAPNMQVKMPCTAAGVAMIEEATFRGVNLNVTVSFSVPQVLAIAGAIEVGLQRREEAGLPVDTMAPVATFMVGRLDDWLKVIAKREGRVTSSEVLDQAGIACAKRAYELFQQHGYRTKLLIAAYRHLGHWSELIGGDVVQTMPYEWQVKANASGIYPMDTHLNPVAAEVITELETYVDFRRAYEPDGMTPAEFDSFGPVVRTLRSFIAAWHDFVGVVRDEMLPNPD